MKYIKLKNKRKIKRVIVKQFVRIIREQQGRKNGKDIVYRKNRKHFIKNNLVIKSASNNIVIYSGRKLMWSDAGYFLSWYNLINLI